VFFRRTMSKVASVMGLGRSGTVSRPANLTPQSRTIEEFLRAEYEKAQAEFDRAKEDSPFAPDLDICRRYIQATERLRKFLAYGEVPCDALERLRAEDAE
jgi:hypothetical protein